jgi:hypothetical protein
MGRLQLVQTFAVPVLTISPWQSAHVITVLIIGGCLMIAFVVWENFTEYPMIPGKLFAHRVRVILSQV